MLTLGDNFLRLPGVARRLGYYMAILDGDLWRTNFAHVRVVDVTEDYRYMMDSPAPMPLPSDWYPILDERWIPLQTLRGLPDASLVEGYLYDWHHSPEVPSDPWVVGVVNREIASLTDR